MTITPARLSHFRKLHQAGLVTRRFLVMTALECGENNSRLFRDLAEVCGMQKGALSQLLDTMERDRLVQRTVPAKNQRDTRVYLTAAGRDSVRHMLGLLSHFPS